MQKCWSRCKLGQTRVYWFVGVLFEDEILADGYAQTVEEAEERAKQIAGPDSHQWQAYVAAGRHRRKVYEERKTRPAITAGAQVRLYVYRTYTSDFDGTDHALAHLILKWTEKRVYVGERSFPAEYVGTEKEPIFDLGPDDKTFVLDRATLEVEGHADAPSKGWWWGTFYLRLEDALDPWGYRHGRNNPSNPPDGITEALATLGLPWPSTTEDVRAAYRRRSKETHPDSGGSADSFVEINAAYETVKSGLEHWPGFSRVA